MGEGTVGDGGFRGVGGFKSHLRIFEKCIIDKRIMYSKCSMNCPIANYCVHGSELPILTGKSKLPKAGHIFALTGEERRVVESCCAARDVEGHEAVLFIDM